MSIGNLKDQGNKGNNMPYQRAVLELLSQIAVGTGGGGCCPTAATEPTLQTVAKDATLQAVLAAIQGGSLFFNNLVIDTGSPACATPAGCPTYSEVRVWNGTTFVTTYYNADGNVVVPIGPLEYVNPQYVLNDILLQALAINNNTANTATNTFLTAGSTGVIEANTTGVTRTPTMVRSSAAGTVTAGKRSVSIRNAGSGNGTVLGANLLPGEIVNFDAGSLKDTLGAIAYNGTGTDLLITTIG